jgi:UDP-2-acetamido-3-amino-2,3-dideoxy-glucuronate N-acetyltransferase
VSPAGVDVHPLALCEADEIGAGTRVWAFAHVMAGARIGERCNIGDHVYVESGVSIGNGVTVKNHSLLFEGVTLEDDVFVGPNTVFTNDRRPRAPGVRDGNWELVPTVVRRGASLGAQATVVCGVTIGSFALVAAGAVVTSDVPAHALVAGNPARRIGWVCRCCRTLPDDLGCSCGRVYRTEGNGVVPAGPEPEAGP